MSGERLFVLGAALAAPACLLVVPLDGYEGEVKDSGGVSGDTGDEVASPDALADAADGARCPPDRLEYRGACITRPVAYWTLDEGSGETVGDLSGNGIVGAITGARWVPGHVGPGALAFDGASAQVLFGQPARLSFDRGSFAYTLLVLQDAPVGSFDVAWWNGGSSAASPGYDIELGASGWGAAIGDGTKNLVAGFGPPVSGRWVRLVVVVDRQAGELRTYQNAVLAETKNIADLGSLASTQPATLGSRSGSYFFRGTIDDVMIFDRVLTYEDLAALNP